MRVLFVCEGNVNRSQMAAAFLHKLLRDIEIETAGTLVPKEHEGKPVSTVTPNSVEVMKEKGFSIENATMHRLTPEMLERADIVVLMGPTLGGPLPSFLEERSDLRRFEVPDPGYHMIPFKEARDMIEKKVEALAHELYAGS